MQKTKWMKRDPEWIKANPGKGTMYKVDDDGKEIVSSVSNQIEVVVPKASVKSNIIYHKPVNKGPTINGSEPGVYVIVCEIEKTAYVGKSDNVSTRLRSHKMMVFSDKSAGKCSSTYALMREHVEAHGPNCLVFKKHADVNTRYNEDLLKAESELMAYMIQEGYKLYNKLIYREAFEDTIYVPAQYRGNVVKIIEWLTVGEGANDSKFNDFVNSLTEG